TLELIGEGEPALNPDTPYFLAEAARQGCYTRMFSNGTRLTPEISAKLVRARLGTLVVSTFAGRREAYKSITGADLFDRVIRNIQDLQEVKRILGSHRPRISMNCPLLLESLETAPDLVQIASSLGVEYMTFSAAWIFRREMEGESILKVDNERLRE